MISKYYFHIFLLYFLNEFNNIDSYELFFQENEGVILQIRDNSTHIISSNSKVREKLRDILLNCLNHF